MSLLAPVRRLAAVLAGMVVIAMATTGAATAAAPAAAPFAAQAKAVGLSSDQARSLQGQVDQILSKDGGTQVAANEIALPHGSSVLLVLPGQKYAHVLPGAVNLGFAPASAVSRSGNRPADAKPSVVVDGGTLSWYGSTCAYEYLCSWQGTDASGTQWNVSQCNEWQELPGSGWNGNGSWLNNETPGTEAFFGNSSYDTIYTTPGAVSWNADYNWTPVWYIDACDH
ncbi:hypothetical protein [Streptacidiphilus sp. P02-A3a]|uniref:hypothetical protein n=1 Tax=Streptacidiphilus sp. P02-A3a TaxID=2704468 RepID=UPI0015FAAE8F|nr:hypothetical protein [Streptacidiphilus sp. P02-A3a]QMU69928.1 hypothetical protein GXP74_18590 [Streptacidiphilus sp. P02-A3a]